jgi:hypothetical protein
VRTLGYAGADAIARHVVLSPAETDEHLGDLQAHGWIGWSAFAGEGGWSVTEAGRRHGEALLAEELDAVGARPELDAVYAEFLVWNERVTAACTAWQLADLGVADSPVALDEVRGELGAAADRLAALEARLARCLARFAGYHRRFAAALGAAATDPAWITAIDRPSCHRVWFELHEDLIATLGLQR